MFSLTVLTTCALLSAGTAFLQNYDLFIVHESNKTSFTPVHKCVGLPAGFGVEFTEDYVGCGKRTHPQDACSPLHTGPPTPFSFATNISDFECPFFFAVIPRRNCSFVDKVLAAQEANYAAAIIYNYEGESPISMGGSDERVQIPSLMVSYSCAMEILEKYPFEKGYVLTARPGRPSFIFIKYLIPFLCVVAFCFIIMIGAMGYKLLRERRRRHRRRLSRSNLRKIPTKKFKKGEEPETCPICLDDFEDGEKLRVLPCKHAYHTKCVDPWLTKNRKVCPVCKRKVVAGTGESSDSEEESPPAPSTSTSSAPLIPNPQVVGNSTFYGFQGSGADPQAPSSSSSPPADQPPPSTRRGRFVVPGFFRGGRRNLGESSEHLVVPVPPDSPAAAEEGRENPGFQEVTLHPQPQRQRRRRRHPAANAGQASETTTVGLDLDDESNEEGENEDEANPSRTAPSSEFKGKKEGGDRRKKKRRDLMREKREKRSRKVTPQSAPASLRDFSAGEDTPDEEVVVPQAVAREDSIQLDLDEPGDDTQALVSREQPTASANYDEIV